MEILPSNVFGNVVVEHNHVHDIGKGVMSDMGGIYTEGVCAGTRIRYNVVHNLGSQVFGGWGIYHDSGADILGRRTSPTAATRYTYTTPATSRWRTISSLLEGMRR